MTQIETLIDHQAELQGAVDALARELAILGLALCALSFAVMFVLWEVHRE